MRWHVEHGSAGGGEQFGHGGRQRLGQDGGRDGQFGWDGQREHCGRATASPLPKATTESQCEGRPDSSGDILVRITTNGQPAVTQQMGGAWKWDARTSSCDTAVDAVISTASGNAGNCTQVAYAASNPGYKLIVSPAPPLKKVLVSKGPAC